MNETIYGSRKLIDGLNIYVNANFIETILPTSSLISIGLASEMDDYFYAEFTDYDQNQVDDWLQEHVIQNFFFLDDDPEYHRYVDKDQSIILLKGDSCLIRKKLHQWISGIVARTGKTNIHVYADVPTHALICSKQFSYKWNAHVIDVLNKYHMIPLDIRTTYPYIPNNRNTIEKFTEDVKAQMFMKFSPYINFDQERDLSFNALWNVFYTKEYMCMKMKGSK